MLNDEYNYFLKQKNLLLKKYEGKFVVVVDHVIDGPYISMEDAYKAALKKHKPGSFLIQECVKDVPNRQSFHSRVVF